LRFQTHLDEPLQTPWIEELERVAKPGGQILITVKGNAVDLDYDSFDLIYAISVFTYGSGWATAQKLLPWKAPRTTGSPASKRACSAGSKVRNVLAERLDVVVVRPATDPDSDYGQDGYVLRVPAA
jgi:hypothetical protein